MFELIGSEIGLTSVDVLHIMAEADNNDDGVIEYREFIPVATEIIHVSVDRVGEKRYRNRKSGYVCVRLVGRVYSSSDVAYRTTCVSDVTAKIDNKQEVPL